MNLKNKIKCIMKAKVCISGVHGVGKSTICKKIHKTCYIDYSINVMFIPEQFREVVNADFLSTLNIQDKPRVQTEEITLATYAKQLYLENLYTAQGKNILCDRSVLDTFVYCDYFDLADEGEFKGQCFGSVFNEYYKTYTKIYLIEPSDRLIENDGFRMTDKKQQLEVHNLFLEYFRNFDNVEIINQEDAHKEGFINKVVNEFVL